MFTIEDIKSTRKSGGTIFYRGIPLYFTWVLLRTPITANQATLLRLLFGIVSAICFFNESYLIAVLFFNLNIIFDYVDGDIARCKDIVSFTGDYLEEITHALNSIIFLGITFGIYKTFSDFNLLILGTLASMSFLLMSLAVIAGKDIVLFSILKNKTINNVDISSPEITDLSSEDMPGHFINKVFKTLESICISNDVFIITLAVVLDALFMLNSLILCVVFVFYSVSYLVIVSGMLYVKIRYGYLDRYYDHLSKMFVR